MKRKARRKACTWRGWVCIYQNPQDRMPVLRGIIIEREEWSEIVQAWIERHQKGDIRVRITEILPPRRKAGADRKKARHD